MDGPQLISLLLKWYDIFGRDLPWRYKAGAISKYEETTSQSKPDPYRIWLSEIMLQQTTVTAVIPYYKKFIDRWPNVHMLAEASIDNILTAWAGLGYYARARNLHKSAKIISFQYGGVFPNNESDLLKLPGIGTYTAGAIAAIAFNQPTIAVDANVVRALARLYALDVSPPKLKNLINEHSKGIISKTRPGDFLQALMDLGATICTPRNPNCSHCPVVSLCQANRIGNPSNFPKKSKKIIPPQYFGVAFWTVKQNGEIFFRRRPETGLLGGMMEVPGSEWSLIQPKLEDMISFAPCPGSWHLTQGNVNHRFTHFKLQLWVFRGSVDDRCLRQSGQWVNHSLFDELALPTLTKKIINHISSTNLVEL